MLVLTSGGLGVMTSLLQEIISVYTLLNPSQLTAAASNRVCNALALLQCVASHNDTRTLFLNGLWITSPKSGPAANHGPSTHSSFPLSLPQHHLEVATFRVPSTYEPRSYRSTRQERLVRGDQFPPHDGDYPALPPNHGDGLGA